MADAAVGGKTGINLLGFKNQIGAFAHPKAIVLAAQFLETLPERELRAGFAEVLKHALIADPERWKKLTASQELPSNWIEIIAEAVHTKLFFTEKDPKEKGIRKALNFGHTLGHALESYFLHENPENPVLHGEAVAAGMWCEAWLTLQKGSLAPSDFESISSYLSAIYSQIHFTDAQIPSIAAWALQDKKNQGEEIRCVLLNGIGDFQIDQIIHLDEIGDAFRSYQSNYSQR